jgi:intracellular septation protein A
MRELLKAAKFLVLDLASTLFFLAVYLLTHNTVLAVGLGIAVGLAQIGNQYFRGRPIATMEWLSLFLIVGAGTATLLTNDPRFVLLLKPGWLNRYLPDIVKTVTPDVATAVGFSWAALMFVSAGVNAFVALTRSVQEWALFMPLYGIVSKVAVFLIGFAAIRFFTRRRVRAMPEGEREALLASAGYSVTAQQSPTA